MVSAHVGGHAGASPPRPTGLSVCSLHCCVAQSDGRAVGELAECPSGLDGVTSQRARNQCPTIPMSFVLWGEII